MINTKEISEPDFVDMVMDQHNKECINSLEITIDLYLRLAQTRMKQGNVKGARKYTNKASRKMSELLKLNEV